MVIELLLTAALLAPATADPSRQAVWCAEVGFSRSVENRDLDAFIAYLDPDVRFVTGNISRGPDEVAQEWAGFFDDDGPRIRWRPAIVEVVANGTLAISRGPYRLTLVSEDGEVQEAWGNFNSTWRLNGDGEWRVLFDAGGDHGMTPSAEQIEILNSEPDCL
jgi:ketosteroid isomerase-like protein